MNFVVISSIFIPRVNDIIERKKVIEIVMMWEKYRNDAPFRTFGVGRNKTMFNEPITTPRLQFYLIMEKEIKISTCLRKLSNFYEDDLMSLNKELHQRKNYIKLDPDEKFFRQRISTIRFTL